MGDLSKANAILLPLEPVLSKDVTAMTDAMDRERETKMETSPIHGQAIYQSYCSRIKEACQAYKPLFPSLTSSVKGLHSMLTRLARTASLHAGNLHKALEGLGESQEIRSQEMNFSRQELEGDDTEFVNKDTDILSKSDGENDEDFLGTTRLSLQDKGWISPPDSIYSSSLESGITSADTSLADSFSGSDLIEQLSHEPDNKETKYVIESVSPTGHGVPATLQSESKYKDVNSTGNGSIEEQQLKVVASPSHSTNPEALVVNFDEPSPSNQDKVEEENHETPLPNTDATCRTTRGKNDYAMSVLRRVEMKLDGQDISGNREISIATQVDYLLKQATSVDNLCDTYEGWTPWI